MRESDKNIEQLIDKMMTEEKLQSPSIDFTSKIMAEVLILEEKKLKTYKPLIPKPIWISIGIALAFLVIYASLFQFQKALLKLTKLENYILIKLLQCSPVFIFLKISCTLF